jgi:hypothetical protein
MRVLESDRLVILLWKNRFVWNVVEVKTEGKTLEKNFDISTEVK